MDYRSCLYRQFLPSQKRDLLQLLQKSGQISLRNIIRRFERARRFRIAFNSSLCGVAAIKLPYSSYVSRLEENASCDLSGRLELGWLVVRESVRERGIGQRLVSGLMDECAGFPVFATVAGWNHVCQTILERVGFSQCSFYYAQHKHILIYTAN